MPPWTKFWQIDQINHFNDSVSFKQTPLSQRFIKLFGTNSGKSRSRRIPETAEVGLLARGDSPEENKTREKNLFVREKMETDVKKKFLNRGFLRKEIKTCPDLLLLSILSTLILSLSLSLSLILFLSLSHTHTHRHIFTLSPFLSRTTVQLLEWTRLKNEVPFAFLAFP